MAAGSVEPSPPGFPDAAGSGAVTGRAVRSPRAYTKLLAGAVAAVTLLDLILLALGSISASGFRHLGTAAVLAALGALAWEPVAWSAGQARRPHALAWIGFPLAALLALAAIPFLAMSAYPPLEGMIFRVEARADEATGTMEVKFPLPVRPGAVNLVLGDLQVPGEYVRRNPGAFHWPSERVLRVELRRVLRDLGTERRPLTIDINGIPGLSLIRFASGEPVPKQRVALK